MSGVVEFLRAITRRAAVPVCSTPLVSSPFVARPPRSRNRAMKNLCLAGAAFAAVFSTAGVALAVPSLLTHQGRLYDSSDEPVNGAVDMEFALYASQNAVTPV